MDELNAPVIAEALALALADAVTADVMVETVLVSTLVLPPSKVP